MSGGVDLELTEGLKELFIKTGKTLKGSQRRLFMARAVQELGKGGQRLAERELGWSRVIIRIGTHELQSGITCHNAYSARGRKSTEERLPKLRDHIKEIVDGQSQTDPQFRNNRLYTRLTPKAVREQLIATKGYQDQELPCTEVIRQRMNQMNYHPKKVQKSLPKKNTSNGCYL
jgi:hypothetical protein